MKHTKAELEKENIEFKKRHKKLLKANQDSMERRVELSTANSNLLSENAGLKSNIDGLANENAELISETQRLNHLVETQKVEIESLHKVINVKDDRIKELRTEVYDLENNNHELLELIKPTPQPKPSLLQRFINLLS